MTFFLLLLLHVPVRTSISYLCKSYPGVVCFISRASLIRTVFVSSLVPSQFTTQLPPLFCLPLVHNLGSLFSSPPLSLPSPFPVLCRKMASNQPSLLEYARFYNVAEDSTRYCPINYADKTCEPTTPIPPVEGLDPEHPEERLKEIDRRFCTELMMEKLPVKPEDMDMLAGCLQLDSFNRNLWRGILPQVTTSDVKHEPYLLTAVHERMVASSEFHANFAQSPTPSSPIPSVRLVVPSGPDVPVVPMNTRDVFEHYNSEMSQSNSAEGFTAPETVAAGFSNIPTTSYLAGDAVPPIVGPSGIVHQFVSVESDPVPSIEDQENESYASSELSSEVST